MSNTGHILLFVVKLCIIRAGSSWMGDPSKNFDNVTMSTLLCPMAENSLRILLKLLKIHTFV